MCRRNLNNPVFRNLYIFSSRRFAAMALLAMPLHRFFDRWPRAQAWRGPEAILAQLCFAPMQGIAARFSRAAAALLVA
jgi:hypothetical protein